MAQSNEPIPLGKREAKRPVSRGDAGREIMGPKWRLVILLAAGLALDYLARLALFSVVPLWRDELHASDLVFGLVASSFLWVYGFLSPAAGFLGDRFSRRTVVIVSLTAWSVVALLTGLITSGWQMVALRALMAVTQVCYVPVALALIADFHGPDTRGRASGYVQIGSSIGIFLSGLPAAWVATRLGWRSMVIVCGLAGILLALVLVRWLPHLPALSQEKGPRASPVAIREAVGLLRAPPALALIAAFTMTSMAYWILFSYLPLFVYQRYHLSLAAAAFQATFYIQIADVLAMPVYATAADRWATSDPRNRYLACAVASTFGFPALLAVGAAHQIVILIGGLICFGGVMASSDSSWLPMLCDVAAPRLRATAYGLLNFFGTLAGGVAAFVTALIMRRVGLGVIIAAAALMYVLIAGLLLLSGYVLLQRYHPSVTGSSN